MYTVVVRRGGALRQDYVKVGFLFVVLILVTLIAPHAAAASTYRWHTNAAGNWNDPANWTVTEGPAGAGYPNLPGDTAIFDTLTGVKTIAIPDAVTVTAGRLSFTVAANGDRVEVVSQGSGRLILDNAGADAVIASAGDGQGSVSGIQLNANLIVEAEERARLNAISEAGGARNVTITGGGDVGFGTAPNTYTGTTTVISGRLFCDVANAVRIPGPLVIGIPSADPPFAFAAIQANQMGGNSDLTIGRNGQMLLSGYPTPDLQLDDVTIEDGSLDITGVRLTVSTLTMRGGRVVTSEIQVPTEMVLLGKLTATSTARGSARITSNVTIGGILRLTTAVQDFVIGDGPQENDLIVGADIAGAGLGVRKLGAGAALFFNASYTGGTTIAEGTLYASAPNMTSAFSVAAGATLGGGGKTGPINVAPGGVISPGYVDTVSWIQTGSVTLAAGAHFIVHIEGTPGTTGAGYDRLYVTGTVDLGNATLDLTSVQDLRADDTYTLIDNDGADQVTGTFAGLPEGAAIDTASGAHFTLSYHGGDGNDVVLTNLTSVSYFLSEGATGTFFDEDVAIANPHDMPAPITMTFFLTGGGTVVQHRVVPPLSRITVAVDQIPGLEAASPSVEVRSDNRLPLAVERSMFWDANYYGGHTANAVRQAERQWLFAEGAQGFFDTYLLLANPNDTAQNATVTFFRENEPEVVDTIPLPPRSRTTVSARDYPALADRAFGMMVDAPMPITAERAMYFATSPERLWKGGHANVGITAPSTQWFHAEGATGTFFTTFLLLSNPQSTPATVTLKFLRPDNTTFPTPWPIEITKTIPPRARLTINPAAEGNPELTNALFSTAITSNVPIVSERAMYWSGGDIPFGEGHASSGVAEAWPVWGLAEGRVGGPRNYATYILLANASTRIANVKLTFLRENGPAVVKHYSMMSESRLTVDVQSMVPELKDESFGTLVESLDAPISVERSIYWNADGRFWAGGTNALGSVLPR